MQMTLRIESRIPLSKTPAYLLLLFNSAIKFRIPQQGIKQIRLATSLVGIIDDEASNSTFLLEIFKEATTSYTCEGGREDSWKYEAETLGEEAKTYVETNERSK